MKHVLSVIFFTFCLLVSSTTAQPQREQRRFNPQKFQAELEQFITTEAGLTPQAVSYTHLTLPTTPYV